MSELSDRELTGTLERAAVGGDIGEDGRARIRAQVLTEFDRSVIETAPPPAQAVELTPAAVERSMFDHRRWTIAAAAAVTAVMVGGLVLLASRDSNEEPVTDVPTVTSTTPPSTTAPPPPSTPVPSIDELSVGEPIPPGRYRTAVAGGLAFEVPDGAVLEAVAADRLTVAVADRDASITIATVADVARLDAAVERAETDGLLLVENSAGRIGDRPIARWDLTLTPPFRTIELNCVAAEPCDVLGEIDPGVSAVLLQPGAENFVTPLELDDGTAVAIIERFSAFGSPTSAIANAILDTIQPV